MFFDLLSIFTLDRINYKNRINYDLTLNVPMLSISFGRQLASIISPLLKPAK